MASHTHNSFHDGHLRATLPDALAVYDVEQVREIPEGVAHVDWAWDEPSVHFLCELRDGESPWALEDRDNPEKLQKRLQDFSYIQKLANKALQTSSFHEPSKREPKVYVVVIAIESLTGAELDAVGQVLEREMKEIGLTAPGIVVNIAKWNRDLAPRKMERVSG